MGFVSVSRPLAVITGASSGIGQAVARQLAQRGHRTVLIARRGDRLNQLSKELATFAPSIGCRVDLADAFAVDQAIARIIAEHGPVAVLIHGAGYNLLRSFLDQQSGEVQRLMQVHYFAATQLIRAALPGMLDQQRGHVINIGSIAAKVSPWGHGGYSASKAALLSLTQTLAAEYGDQGIHFSYVQPSIVHSEFFNEPGYNALAADMRKHAVSCQYMAKRIVNLLDRPRLELIVPRHHRIVDWLKLLVPGFVHGRMARQSRPAADAKHVPRIDTVQLAQPIKQGTALMHRSGGAHCNPE